MCSLRSPPWVTATLVTVSDDRIAVGFDGLEAGPGEVVTGSVSANETVTDLEAEICVATNDPDEPLLHLSVASSSSGASVNIGEPAPDFTLQDLEGNYHTLSQSLGHPVILCYFATW